MNLDISQTIQIKTHTSFHHSKRNKVFYFKTSQKVNIFRTDSNLSTLTKKQAAKTLLKGHTHAGGRVNSQLLISELSSFAQCFEIFQFQAMASQALLSQRPKYDT